MLSRGIENYSPEQHEVELTSRRMSMTPDNRTSSRSEGSRKYFSTVRNFGSSVDDESDRQESESFSERYYRLHMGTTSKMTENKKPREFIDENEDVESQVPPNPHVHDLSDSSSSSSQEVTKETLIKMEQSFQKYSDLKSIPIQIHTLSISAIYSFLNVLNILLENSKSSLLSFIISIDSF